jgi:hypothetical protein
MLDACEVGRLIVMQKREKLENARGSSAAIPEVHMQTMKAERFFFFNYYLDCNVLIFETLLNLVTFQKSKCYQ